MFFLGLVIGLLITALLRVIFKPVILTPPKKVCKHPITHHYLTDKGPYQVWCYTCSRVQVKKKGPWVSPTIELKKALKATSETVE